MIRLLSASPVEGGNGCSLKDLEFGKDIEADQDPGDTLKAFAGSGADRSGHVQ
jgi:hypothetical protein